MIKTFFDWTKANKAATLVIFVLLIVLVNKEYPKYRYLMQSKMMGISGNALYEGNAGYGTDMGYMDAPLGTKEAMSIGRPVNTMMPPYIPPVPPTPGVTDRKVITNANMSLQVASVTDSISEIKGQVSALSGYVVNVYLNRPEFGENASVSVRIPSDKVDTFMDFLRKSAIKVVNEDISGADITDQYVDTETRIAQLELQKGNLQAILNKAEKVEDIINVQNYITELQNQIDMLKGQNNYADAASQYALITLYLSTDELSLPYTPDLAWRPQAIFKNAIRSLLVTLQTGGTALIWLGVYSVLVIPALTIIVLLYMWAMRKQRRQ